MQGESLPVKLVVESPIPLNDEQREIRQALKDPRCRFVVVEGPPGTGKSHSITALAFDAIMHGKSTLILSDKAEALDVVEDKLDSTLLAVRGDDEFENPILRLGRQGANYRKLTSRASLTQLRTHHAAQLTNRTKLDNELKSIKEQLSREVTKTLDIYSKLPMAELAAHIGMEAKIQEKSGAAFVAALNRTSEDPKLIEVFTGLAGADAEQLAAKIDAVLEGTRYPNLLALLKDLRLASMAADLNERTEAPTAGLDLMKPLSTESAKRCYEIYTRFVALKRPLIGYLFRAPQVAAIEHELYATELTRGPINLRSRGYQVKALLDYVLNLSENLDKHHVPQSDLELIQVWMRKRPNATGLEGVRKVLGSWMGAAQQEPELAAMHGRRAGEAVEAILQAARHACERHKIVKMFSELPRLDYLSDKTKLERLYTSKMTEIVDHRFLDFADQQAAKMKTLAGVISARAKFPTDHFDALRNACPVILASIREFAEYMPLQKDLFDLVIIDEGSQVSIAQALPAILRGKQIVVFGDSRQFSNVKSTNASIERNNVYKSNLRAFFEAKISKDAARLTRLKSFDVKASVLEFFGYCANFHIMLTKHFRSPQELISFSSETFYQKQLQAIKLRSLPIEETIRFDIVPPSEGGEPLRNVNKAEAEFIMAKLRIMLQDEAPPTVGIITPHREQQVYLTREITRSPEWPDFESKLKLKIMTFDTCQGEEREVIMYSLVATKERDVLNYVFPAAMTALPDDVEEKLKLQRLNVGFSRAQETIWFVLSKQPTEYKGSIAHVLNHYERVLKERQLGEAEDTDPRSPMEPQVLAWLKATPFVQKHAGKVEIRPGFPIGRYLSQLDPSYRHPLWKVDFLITVDVDGEVVKIVIEYDGFEFHFGDARGVNAGNYETYMSEADLYRQLVLESYGYHFLRLNRFNLGRDPITTLSERLEEKLDGATSDALSATASHVIRTRQDIQNGTQKECSRCHQVKPLEAFFDHRLKGGEGAHGRVCNLCKGGRGGGGTWRRKRRRW